MAANEQIQALTASVQEHIGVTQGFLDEADGSIAAGLQHINQHIADAKSKMPMLNLMPNSGTYHDDLAKDQVLYSFNPLVYDANLGCGLGSYNGSTIEEGGYFSNGEGSSNTDVDQLITKIKTFHNKHTVWGTPFRIAKCTAGDGQYVPHPTHQHLYLTARPSVYNVSGKHTYLEWIKVLQGELAPRYENVYIDGVISSRDQIKRVNDGWFHISHTLNVVNGYWTIDVPATSSDCVFLRGLTAVVPGDFSGVVHAAPVRSI